MRRLPSNEGIKEGYPLLEIVILPLLARACERSVSGAENGAERAENGMSGSGAVSGC